MKKIISAVLVFTPCLFAADVLAPMIGDKAPTFITETNEGQKFDLSERKGHWTVLYFYPKAETPGCTKQACAFRDSLKKVRALDADVFGISGDTVAQIESFHKNHQLNFTLLADSSSAVMKSYGVKMPILKMAKRWTFIIGPDLTIKFIDENVDPVKDPEHVIEKLKQFQALKS